MHGILLGCLTSLTMTCAYQSPAADRAARFEREDRELGLTRVHEVKVSGVWKKKYGESWTEPRRHSAEIEARFGSALADRSMGFSQSVAVLPAGIRRDGTPMPPTCVFGLPSDGKGSIWFLTPEGLETECFALPDAVNGSSRFGFVVEVGPDHDGDGIQELIITAPGEEGDDGAAYLFSVAERRVLLEVHAPAAKGPFGVAACAVPDADGDGREELAILSGGPMPRITIYSTADCSVLDAIELDACTPTKGWRPHHRLRVLPRANPDEGALLYVSMPGTHVQELAVLELETHSVRWAIGCQPLDDHTGLHWCRYSSVVTTEDLDGDGIDELLVAGYSEYESPSAYAEFSVLSGSSGESLRTTRRVFFCGGGDGEAFIADYPDIDCDGFREHILCMSGAFSRDAIVFSGRSGEPLYEIDLGDLPFRYSNDIQSHVDWNGDGTLDLVLHDTDVWAYGTEQQLIVLSMADHKALHYIRPGDVEDLILAREGWMDDPANAAPWARLADVRFDFAKVPVVNASEPCSGEPAEELPELETKRPSASMAHDLGKVMAVIPGFRDAEGEERPPLVAFGLEHDERGSLWLLAPGTRDPVRIGAPELPEAIRRFGKSLVLVGDLDGDGARDLAVGAEARGSDNTRFLLYSSAKRELIHELEARSSFHRAPLQSVPDQDGDGVPDLAFLADRQTLAGRASHSRVRIQISSGATGGSLRSFELSRSVIWSPGVRLAAIAGDAETPDLLVLGGRDLIAIDLTTGEPAWSSGSERTSKLQVMDLCTTQDLNGDSIPELLVAVARGRRGPTLAWHCGRTGKRLREAEPFEPDKLKHGFASCAYVDTDGDGFREVLATRHEGPGSSVVVYGGRTGAPLQRIDDPFTWGNGSFLDASVDWDGKGLPDIVLGSNIPTTGSAAAEFCILSMEDHCLLRFVDSTDIARVIAAEAEAADR